MSDSPTPTLYTIDDLKGMFDIPTRFVNSLVRKDMITSYEVDEQTLYDVDEVRPLYLYAVEIAQEAIKRARVRTGAEAVRKRGKRAARTRKKIRPDPPPYIDIEDIDDRMTRLFRARIWGDSIEIVPREPHLPKLKRLLVPIKRRR